MTTVRVATSESWKDKQTGQMQERTEWHRVKFFGRLAEIAGEYLRKGRQIYVEGSIRTDKFTGNDGVEKYFTEIVANEMQMLGGNDGANAGQGNGQGRQGSQPPRNGSNGGQSNRQQGNGGGYSNGNEDFGSPPPGQEAFGGGGGFRDDDIPFRQAGWRTIA